MPVFWTPVVVIVGRVGVVVEDGGSWVETEMEGGGWEGRRVVEALAALKKSSERRRSVRLEEAERRGSSTVRARETPEVERRWFDWEELLREWPEKDAAEERRGSWSVEARTRDPS